MRVVIKNMEDTNAFAERLVDQLEKGDVIALTGDLGAGKTTLTQDICYYLHVEEYVTSPTFNIVNTYEGFSDALESDLKVHHFDVYRIDDIEEMYDIGFDEYAYDESAISIIEWADKIEDIMPEHTLWLNMTLGDQGERYIDIESSEKEIE